MEQKLEDPKDREERLQRLLNLHKAAFYLGLSYWSLRGLLHNGQIPFIRVGRRILIDRNDLDAWVEANKVREDSF